MKGWCEEHGQYINTCKKCDWIRNAHSWHHGPGVLIRLYNIRMGYVQQDLTHELLDTWLHGR